MRVHDEALRIVSDQFWKRANESLSLRAPSPGRRHVDGTPPALLAGLARCGLCGLGITAERGRYFCGGRRHRHAGACKNDMNPPIEATNEAVLKAVEEHLRSEYVEEALTLLDQERADVDRAPLEAELRDVEAQTERITSAIAKGGELAALVAKLKTIEARRAEITRELAAAAPIPRPSKTKVATTLAAWKRALRSDVEGARDVLRRVVKGRISFEPLPDGQGATFEAETRWVGLFVGTELSGIVTVPHVAIDDETGREAYLEKVLEAAFKRARKHGKQNKPAGGRCPWR